MSDFQADWGVSAHLALQGHEIKAVVHEIDTIIVNENKLNLMPYHSTEPIKKVPFDQVLFIAFRYDKSFKGLLEGDLFIFTDLASYLKFKENEIQS